MKFLILCSLILLASCNDDNCNARNDNENQERLTVDFQNDNDRQGECIRKLLNNNDNIHEVEINIGDRDGNQKTDTNGQRLKQILRACNDDKNNVDRITINMNNAHGDDNNDDCELNTIKEMRFNLRTKEDCDTTRNLLNKMTARDLRSFELYTNSDNEVGNALDFVARNCDNLRYVRLNSDQGDFQSDRDKFFLRTRDTGRKIDDEQMNNLKKIRQTHDRQGGDRNQLREIDIRCGNDLSQFAFVFKKGNQSLRKVKTNRGNDLTQLDDDKRFNNVWGMDIRVDVTEDNLNKLNQHFPNVKLILISTKDQNGMTDDQRNMVKNIFKNTDRRMECRKF